MEFVNNNNDNNNNEENGQQPFTLEVDGEVLTEVITSDDPIEDMSETGSEYNDIEDLEEVLDEDDIVQEDIVEMCDFKFEGHSDSVYCVKVNYIYNTCVTYM